MIGDLVVPIGVAISAFYLVRIAGLLSELSTRVAAIERQFRLLSHRDPDGTPETISDRVESIRKVLWKRL